MPLADLEFETYAQLHIRLTKLLSPTFEGSAEKLARVDWTDDLTAAGAARTGVDGIMAHDVFVDSLFELADLWTSADPAEDLSAAAAAYRDFLAQALERITVPGGRALLPVDTPALDAILQNHGGEPEPEPEPEPESHTGLPSGWRPLEAIMPCVGAGEAPLAVALREPPPPPPPPPRGLTSPTVSTRASESLAEESKVFTDDSVPSVGGWGVVDDVTQKTATQPKPGKTTAKRKKGSKERRAKAGQAAPAGGRRGGVRVEEEKGDWQEVQPETAAKIEHARMVHRQDTVEVGERSYDLRNMRAKPVSIPNARTSQPCRRSVAQTFQLDSRTTI